MLVAGHRWPALTRALVADVHAHGRAVVGVHDRDEVASREHLIALGVDALVESDAGPDAFVRAIVSVAGRREDRTHRVRSPSRAACGRLVTVGGPPGVGRTEIAIELALALGRRQSRAARRRRRRRAGNRAAACSLPIEPNLRTAIDAVEHGRGELDRCIVVEPASRLQVVTGLPNASAWAQVRPSEVVRVVDRLADDVDVVVADGAGMLEEVGTSTARGRFATARALVAESDVLVAVCDPSPHGVARLLGWAVEALALAPDRIGAGRGEPRTRRTVPARRALRRDHVEPSAASTSRSFPPTGGSWRRRGTARRSGAAGSRAPSPMSRNSVVRVAPASGGPHAARAARRDGSHRRVRHHPPRRDHRHRTTTAPARRADRRGSRRDRARRRRLPAARAARRRGPARRSAGDGAARVAFDHRARTAERTAGAARCRGGLRRRRAGDVSRYRRSAARA